MTENLAGIIRGAYQDVRSVPAVPLHRRVEKMPVPTSLLITKLQETIRAMFPPQTFVETELPGLCAASETNSSSAYLALAEATAGTVNEHAIGAVAAIGAIRDVSSELAERSTYVRTAVGRIGAAAAELTEALEGYGIVMAGIDRQTEVVLEARTIAMDNLKAYYTDVTGRNIREQ